MDIYGPIMAEEENSIEAYIYNILVGESCDLSDDVLDGFYFDNDMVGGRDEELHRGASDSVSVLRKT